MDMNPSGGVNLEFILRSSTLASLSRPSSPYSEVSPAQTYIGTNSLTLSFQYRIICTAGTCGSDCSQTTNCTSFPTCLPTICDDFPCQNGGTCTDVCEIVIDSFNAYNDGQI